MRPPTLTDAVARLTLDNPWWEGGSSGLVGWPRRGFFDAVFRRLDKPGVVHLAGPRRAGKTVLARQVLDRLIETGTPPRAVVYCDLSSPAADRQPLTDLVAAVRAGAPDGRGVVVLDDAHRRPDWEAEIAALAGAFPALTVLAVSGLRPSGSHLTLPPLTFQEYLRLTGCEAALIETMFFGKAGAGRTAMHVVRDMAELDRRFLSYLDGGGYPECVLLRPPAAEGAHILRTRIAEAALLGDLPARLGVGDTGDLQALFLLLAANTGSETSLEALAATSDLAKNTLRRYLDVLEAAMLIHRMPRVHPQGARFRRMRTFKVHLTSPSLYAALFGPAGEARFAERAESAVIGQWLASPELPRLHFARLGEGDVDLVSLDPDSGRPVWACQLPADDRTGDDAVAGLVRFAHLNAPLRWIGAITRTQAALKAHDGVEVWHRPVAQYCYEIGRRAADDA